MLRRTKYPRQLHALAAAATTPNLLVPPAGTRAIVTFWYSMMSTASGYVWPALASAPAAGIAPVMYAGGGQTQMGHRNNTDEGLFEVPAGEVLIINNSIGGGQADIYIEYVLEAV